MKSRGDRGEQVAVDYLEQRGYRVVDRAAVIVAEDFRGELDIVCVDESGATVVFVEVKYRATALDGAGVAAVSPAKLRRVRQASGVWMAQHREDVGGWKQCRVDVIDVGPDGVRLHLENVW